MAERGGRDSSGGLVRAAWDRASEWKVATGQYILRECHEQQLPRVLVEVDEGIHVSEEKGVHVHVSCHNFNILITLST